MTNSHDAVRGTYRGTDGAELAYAEWGPRGDIPIVLVHGWLASSTIWAPVAEHLAERHRTLAVDLRGFGASAAAPGPYRVENLADDLGALVAALDLDPFVLVGHSLGAAVAQRFAVDRPDAVEGLVLVAPVAADGFRFGEQLDAVFRAIPGHPENVRAWLAKLTHGELDASLLARLQNDAAAVDPDVALANYDSWSRLDFADEVATIATPTLVLAASADRPMTPRLVRERVARIIPGSEFQVIDEAGHYLPLERPRIVADAIARFVDAL